MKLDDTAEGVFRQCANHLLEQQQKSVSRDCNDFSLYHGPNKLKCPVGIFIRGDTSDIEGMPWDDAAVLKRLDVPATTSVKKVLKLFQELHDEVLPSYWASRIYAAAKRFHVEKKR